MDGRRAVGRAKGSRARGGVDRDTAVFGRAQRSAAATCVPFPARCVGTLRARPCVAEAQRSRGDVELSRRTQRRSGGSCWSRRRTPRRGRSTLGSIYPWCIPHHGRRTDRDPSGHPRGAGARPSSARSRLGGRWTGFGRAACIRRRERSGCPRLARALRSGALASSSVATPGTMTGVRSPGAARFRGSGIARQLVLAMVAADQA